MIAFGIRLLRNYVLLPLTQNRLLTSVAEYIVSQNIQCRIIKFKPSSLSHDSKRTHPSLDCAQDGAHACSL